MAEYLGLVAMGVTLVFMLVGLPVQIVRNFRARSTGELSLTMCMLWLTTLVAWVSYGVARSDLNIIIPNGLGVVLVGSLLGQVLYYGRR